MSADTDAIVDPDTYVTGVPHEVFARLRAESAVVWMDEPGEGAVVLRPGCETRPRCGFESSGMMRVFA